MTAPAGETVKNDLTLAATSQPIRSGREEILNDVSDEGMREDIGGGGRCPLACTFLQADQKRLFEFQKSQSKQHLDASGRD